MTRYEMAGGTDPGTGAMSKAASFQDAVVFPRTNRPEAKTAFHRLLAHHGVNAIGSMMDRAQVSDARITIENEA